MYVLLNCEEQFPEFFKRFDTDRKWKAYRNTIRFIPDFIGSDSKWEKIRKSNKKEIRYSKNRLRRIRKGKNNTQYQYYQH